MIKTRRRITKIVVILKTPSASIIIPVNTSNASSDMLETTFFTGIDQHQLIGLIDLHILITIGWIYLVKGIYDLGFFISESSGKNINDLI
jgi:hypothetical protein